MFTILQSATLKSPKITRRTGILGLKTCVNVLRITFISGPWMLLTSRLSFKSASMMIMLCAPALLFCGMLTIPAILFPSPQQNAYFYFAEGLNHDPIRWLGLLLGCACSLLALAVPAAADDSGASLRF